MGHDDEHTAEAAAAERLEHEHPARPEQPNEGFAEGVDHKPDAPEEQLEPNYARGIAHEDPPGTQRHGRFSEGAEQLPDSPEKEVERRFSEGIERSPTSEQRARPHGVERMRVAGHGRLKRLLTDAGLDDVAAAREVHALHEDRILVLVDVPEEDAERARALLER